MYTPQTNMTGSVIVAKKEQLPSTESRDKLRDLRLKAEAREKETPCSSRMCPTVVAPPLPKEEEHESTALGDAEEAGLFVISHKNYMRPLKKRARRGNDNKGGSGGNNNSGSGAGSTGDAPPSDNEDDVTDNENEGDDTTTTTTLIPL
eukprot:sb/3473734/